MAAVSISRQMRTVIPSVKASIRLRTSVPRRFEGWRKGRIDSKLAKSWPRARSSRHGGLAVVQIVAEGSTHSFLPTKQLPSRFTNEDLKAYGVLNGMPDSIVHVRSTHDTMVKTS